LNQDISIQHVSNSSGIPPDESFIQWINAALLGSINDIEICIRIIDENEMQALNYQFREKNKPTNVLSFPYHDEFDEPGTIQGDIIICAPVLKKEANEQGKPLQAHWAHLTIHGMLHIQGFDHENNQDAEIMENHEINILNHLGFKNPYLTVSTE